MILRLGGVISADLDAMPFSGDALFFESALPTDGRIHTVDVRDVASAFAAATTADVVGETLLIAGDESHLLRQKDIGRRWPRPAGCRTSCPPAAPVTPTVTKTGSSPTGWTPPVRSRRCRSSTTRGRTCSRRCAPPPDGVATRCRLVSPDRAAVAQTPGRVPGRAGSLCRPVGGDPIPARRARAGLIDLHRVAGAQHRHSRRRGETETEPVVGLLN